MKTSPVFWNTAQVELKVPSYVYTSLGVILLGIGIGLAILGWVTYIAAYPVSGWADYRLPPVKIYSNTAGVIEEIYVQEGGRVNKGAALLRIEKNDTISATSSTKLFADDLKGMLAQKMEFIEQQIQSEVAVQQTKLAGLNNTVRHIEEDIKIIMLQIEINHQKRDVISERKARQSEMLAKGYVSQDSFDLLDIELLTVQNQLQELIRSRNAKLQAKEDALSGIDSLNVEHLRRLAELKSVQSDISLQLLESDRLNGYVVTAPMSGVVNNVNAFLGASLDGASLARNSLLTILPLDNEIVLFLLIPSELIARVNVGETLDLRIKSELTKKTEEIAGTIIYLSPLALTPQELENFSHVPIPAETFHLAKVRPTISWDEDPSKLQPGVRLTASVPFEKTNMLQWLFDRFLYGGGGK